MSDFDVLKALQHELIMTLENRMHTDFITREVSRAKIRRLRLQINEVMLRIEKKCDSFMSKRVERWE